MCLIFKWKSTFPRLGSCGFGWWFTFSGQWPLMRFGVKGLRSPYVKEVQVADKASEQADVTVEILYKVPFQSRTNKMGQQTYKQKLVPNCVHKSCISCYNAAITNLSLIQSGKNYFKHRKNCEYCPCHSYSTVTINFEIVVLNFQKCNQCFKGHKSQ